MILSKKSWATTLLALSLASGCSSAPSSPPLTQASSSPAAESQVPAGILTQEEAFTRSKQVAHVTYELWFGLEDEHLDYEGRTVVNFELRSKAKDHGKNIFLDFTNGTLRSIVLNGTTLADIASPERYDGNRIHFKLSELQPSTNRIEIAFVHPYGQNGHGLHRFKDPVDQAVYLYSDLEPFFAHQIFPCFDQPDLKAAFELTVETPPDWQVVSNTLERETSNVDGRKSWAFPPTPLLSTYVFALIAGDYASWKGDAEGIPLRLFARKSLKQYVDSEEWFDITRKGLDFYSVQFGYPYPYSKYDQIIVPEFDAGAMENAAAITFSESHIFRTKVTRQRHEDLAETILHEMAHMWFGDLVTMKWWNGLWLNESFATFMSYWNAAETRPIHGTTAEMSWELFFNNEKDWAYWQDQLVTTHPVDLPVPDTDHAFSNFDGITYGKGASAIKQLRYYLGDDDFREGIQRYFQKYALRNTTLSEFIKMLSEASGKDLTSWQESWLTTSGVNTIRADWACDADGKISKFDLIQSLGNSKILRQHKTEIGLFSTKLQVKDKIAVSYSGAQTAVSDAIGKACPALVYPNIEDYDYVKVELDPISLLAVSERLSQVNDVLSREMLWLSLWDMVVDGKLAPQAYVNIALTQLVTEKDPQIEQKVIRSLMNPHLYAQSALKFISPDQRLQYLPQLEALASKKLHSAAPGSDAQLIWFQAMLDYSSTAPTFELARKLLDGKAKISGLKIDQEVRWSLVQALARSKTLGTDEMKAMIDHELALDPTDRGKKLAMQASVQIPDPKEKSDWAAKVFSRGLNVDSLRGVMRGFYILGQEDLGEQFVDAYFSGLAKAVKSTDEEYVEAYTGAFFPALCTQKVVALTTQALKNPLPADAQKNLMVNRQEEERCLRARQTPMTAQ